MAGFGSYLKKHTETLVKDGRIETACELTGKSIRFASNTPLQDVAALSAQSVAFQTLNIARPNLENVFLTLTGRSLRDG